MDHNDHDDGLMVRRVVGSILMILLPVVLLTGGVLTLRYGWMLAVTQVGRYPFWAQTSAKILESTARELKNGEVSYRLRYSYEIEGATYLGSGILPDAKAPLFLPIDPARVVTGAAIPIQVNPRAVSNSYVGPPLRWRNIVRLILVGILGFALTVGGLSVLQMMWVEFNLSIIERRRQRRMRDESNK